MAYGAEISGQSVGNWDGFILNSTIQDLRSYVPVVISTTAVTVGSQYPSYTLGDLLFARPHDGAGTIYTDFRNPSQPVAKGESQQYVLMRPTGTSISSNANGTNYGLQILNSAGDTIYDSRKSSGGFNIKATVGARSMSGTTGYPTYIPVDHSTNLMYGSAASTTYVLMNGTAYYTIGPMDIYEGIYFKPLTTNIYWSGKWYFSFGSNNASYGGLKNSGEIIIGDII
tara:strand:+ start:1108 stop:1788 length:681 start_codon:yes stop_codon:yes gene_type:complete